MAACCACSAGDAHGLSSLEHRFTCTLRCQPCMSIISICLHLLCIDGVMLLHATSRELEPRDWPCLRRRAVQEEIVAWVRRRSSAFSRGRSRFRGVSGQQGRWEARIGTFAGRKNARLALT